MVKISHEIMDEVSKLSSLNTLYEQLVAPILEEQPDISVVLASAGLINIEMLRGFAVAYHCIKRSFELKEIRDLEKMFKEDLKCPPLK